MGTIVAVGPCVVCATEIQFNPDKVPSYKGHPICANCVEAANKRRELKGLPPFVIYADSYAPQET